MKYIFFVLCFIFSQLSFAQSDTKVKMTADVSPGMIFSGAPLITGGSLTIDYVTANQLLGVGATFHGVSFDYYGQHIAFMADVRGVFKADNRSYIMPFIQFGLPTGNIEKGHYCMNTGLGLLIKRPKRLGFYINGKYSMVNYGSNKYADNVFVSIGIGI